MRGVGFLHTQTMPSKDVSSLRADVARLRKAATRKISRLKTGHDVIVSGTSFDPRVPASQEKQLSLSQLRAYRHELAGFMSRENQFVPDAQKRPLPRKEWQAYKNLESQYNEKVHSYFDRVKDIQLPNGETIAERMAKITPDHRQMGNLAVQAPYDPVTRNSTAIASNKALEKLIDTMRQRIEPGWFEKKNNEGKEQLAKMLDILNDPSLTDSVKDLSSEQFAALWNYSSFATAVSIQYELALKSLSDKEKPWESDLTEQALRRAHELIAWAKRLPVGG